MRVATGFIAPQRMTGIGVDILHEFLDCRCVRKSAFLPFCGSRSSI